MPGLILVVDDEIGTRSITSKLLEREGYSVIEANDAREALVALDNNQPDLIVTDYMMPGMDGIDLIRTIRARAAFARTPILLRSVHLDNPMEIKEAQEAGATDVFAISRMSTLGPSSFNMLVQKVQALLGQPT
jgi:two-component system phosphate regulon response regulator PhoB